jgi:hypothetical protein
VKDERIKTDEKKDSGESEENRRDFLSKSAAAALMLALGAAYGTEAIAQQTQKLTTGKVAQPMAFRPGSFQIDQREASRLNSIRSTLQYAVKTKNMNDAMRRFGRSLSPSDRKVLNSLSVRDLRTLENVNDMMKDFGPVHATVGVIW